MTLLTLIPDEVWRWMVAGAFIGLCLWNLFRTGRNK